ncbi:MAG: chalcone isomerase family protein [Gallionella sp.]|jgi:hypothetical protein
MRKILLIAFLFCLSPAADAVELGGVRVKDTVHLGNSNLVLNGAGVRTKFVFDLYVAALYLNAKKSSATAVLADAGEKRIALHLLDDISAERLLYAFNNAIEDNYTSEELQALSKPMHEFEVIFHQMGPLNKGDVILFDYLRATGTRISVNEGLRGTIPGSAFNNALLKIWLGEHPVQEDLKLKLLGINR